MHFPQMSLQLTAWRQLISHLFLFKNKILCQNGNGLLLALRSEDQNHKAVPAIKLYWD